MAKATTERFPSIRFYGVSCDRYQQMCDDYEVVDFPSIRLFLEEDDPNSFKGRPIESQAKLSPKTLATLLDVVEGSERRQQQQHHIFEVPVEDSGDQDDDSNGEETQEVDPDQDDDALDNSFMSKSNVDEVLFVASPQESSDDGSDEDGTEAPFRDDFDNDESEDPLLDQDDTSEMVLRHAPQPLPPPPRGKNPNAGHLMAKGEFNSMNRYSSTMIGDKETFLRKKNRVFGMRHTPREDTAHVAQASMEESTEAMRVNTPGTVEYQDRNQALIDAIRSRMSRLDRKETQSLQLKKESLPFHKDVRKQTLVKKVAKRIPGVNRMVKMTHEEELIMDASLSLTVALETGVSMGLENEDSRVVMKQWLDLLSVSLPPEWAVHKLIDTLRNKFTYASRNREVFRQVIKDQSIPRSGWSDSCHTKKVPNGFSCGLWKLLHVVTVGVAEQRGGKNLVDSGMMPLDTKTFSPMEAADTIRDFIANFFTCTPCREHFVDNYEDCDNNRRCDRLAYKVNLDEVTVADWKELPLWLWEVHNEVSVRLVNERAQKEVGMRGKRNAVTQRDEIKAVIPNVESCILCFNEDGTWNEGHVFRYLERVYWPGSTVDPKHDKLLTFENDSTRSLGVLWFLVLLIIWFVYAATRKQSRSMQRSILAARIGLKGPKLSGKI